MKRTIFCVLVVLAFLACPLFSDPGENNSAAGIYMKVSGRVIQRELGKGVDGVNIVIYNTADGQRFEAYTDKNGNFEIKMVPPGTYEILVVPIHMTCPYPLVLEKKPEDFEVSIGRNISELNIYLTKGGSISGQVFGPDGITPICDGKVKVVNPLKGKVVEFNLLDEGRFRFDGLNCLEDDEFNFVILVTPDGYANVAKTFKVKTGEEIKDFNFIVGAGEVHVKGNIVSAVDNQPIAGAEVHIISVDRHIEKTSDGYIETDESGNFSIAGFNNTGIVEILIIHDGFETVSVERELKKGINIFNFELNSSQSGKKVSDFFFKDMITSTGSGGATFKDCCDSQESYYNTVIDLSCKKLDNQKSKCIKYKDTLDCLNNKCDKRQKIKIICNKNCPPEPLSGAVACGIATRLNVGKEGVSEFTMCSNANTDCGPLGEITTLFHELFHTCDGESPPNSTQAEPCSEARAHGATACVWDDSHSKTSYGKYKKDCFTVTAK